MVQDVSQPPKKAGLAVNTVDKSYILVGWASLPAYFYDYDLLFTKINVPVLGDFIKRSLLESTAKIVEQDTKALENLYPSQKPKIRLPKEEIMLYVEGLYHEW